MSRQLLLLAAVWAGPGWAQVDVQLAKIDEGVTWVSPYWGYNAPNPFNGQTRFSLDAPGPVELAVYNLKGQQVAVLVQGERSAGWHTVAWNGSGRAIGVYLCRLQTANATLTRKLVLIR